MPFRKRIAVVGSGISGLSAAWLLAKDHEVVLYEAAGRLGGHSNTVTVPVDGRDIPVDTGFIVYNEATYPNLTAFLDHLKVETVRSNMSFGVSLDINVARSAYWQWQKPPEPIRWRNQIPAAIVEAFEAEGFIWGGRWYHYDTMHFEYRPELLDPDCKLE